jgi:hypothetical protein
LRVFAGLRNDAFFFNLAGFRATAEIVTDFLDNLQPNQVDAAGCPTVDAPTSMALVNQLAMAPGGGPAPNSFDTFNVLAIVVSVDKTILTRNGPILSVSGSTHRP